MHLCLPSFLTNILNSRTIRIFSLLFLTFLCTSVRAQKQISFGESYELRSEILDESRVINVLLPVEYADSMQNEYPVIYLLDGATNEDFFHAAGLLRYFDDHDMMPPTILIGIANVDRKRDLTYPSKDPRDIRDFPSTGGSAKFIEFLQQELPVFVNETFRTTDYRTLVGQSLGGLLATEVLLQYPGHFNDYIIVSPSLWWDKEWLYTNMDSLVTALDAYPERLFVSVGEEYPVMVDGSRRLARLMEPHTQSTFLPLMDEDHNTILHEALYRAFDGWYDPTILRPYQFANAWNGLKIRTGPSLDSVVVGKLEYGASLGIISAEAGNEVVIDGLQGKWIYIGSDLGRGWVFDAYVSPVPVFRENERLADYVARDLTLGDKVIYSTFRGGKTGSEMTIQQDSQGNQYVFHQYYEGCGRELLLKGLTSGQAEVTLRNWLSAKGYSMQTADYMLSGGNWTNNNFDEKLQPDGQYLSTRYYFGVLSIYRGCDGPE